MQSTNKKLTIVIINYNSISFLKTLIKSIKKINNITKEIIIIDNNSKEKITKKLFNNKKIIIQKNKKNLGFAKAVNQGIKKAKSDFILLLNPDTKLTDNSIIAMFRFILKKRKIGIVGGKIKQYNNSPKKHLTATSKPTFLTGLFEFTNLKKLFPNNIFTNNFWIENKHKNNKKIEVDSLCGAFLLFRKYLNKKINLFDEKYFLYLEDIDFCLNTKQKGYKVIFYPKSSVEHYGGGSNNSTYDTVLKHWYKSRKYFFKKHTNLISGTILNTVFDIENHLLSLYHYLKNEPSE